MAQRTFADLFSDSDSEAGGAGAGCDDAIVVAAPCPRQPRPSGGFGRGRHGTQQERNCIAAHMRACRADKAKRAAT
eukprot:3257632-Alexandrium_andersonii.AAC.1